MPSVFSHSVAAMAIGSAVAPPGMPLKFWVLTAGCAALPDIDVISFSFDIRYGYMLGHRGITHSFAFAAFLGLAIAFLFFRDTTLFSSSWWLIAAYFFAVTATHPMLDALTNGGSGVAFFAPFTAQRYFFPWRPIQVSPIGLDFFSARGWLVLLSEFKWIWLPSAVLVFLARLIRR